MTESGYELFFNRDEQRSRAQAIAPQIDKQLNAIYPIDPIGQGTWLAVHQSGLSLALLNYYQAEKKQSRDHFISRGEIILALLASKGEVIDNLKKLSLDNYQPFQLCIFPANLNSTRNQLFFLQWDGENLTEQPLLPFYTSSGVDYPEVYLARKSRFEKMVSVENPTTEQLLGFHQQQNSEGKLSVKMYREDAQTVSFSHIQVNNKISFDYIDYLDNKRYHSFLNRC